MKSKFKNLNFGSVEVLSQEQAAKVKGGAYGAGPQSGYVPPVPFPGYIPDPNIKPPSQPCVRYTDASGQYFSSTMDSFYAFATSCTK